MSESVTFKGLDGDMRELAIEGNQLVQYHYMGDLKLEDWRNTYPSEFAAKKEFGNHIRFI